MSTRTDLIRLVHVAKRDLALTDDSYRDLLVRVTGAESSAKLTLPQLDKVMAEFRRNGWKPKPKRFGTSDKPQVRMIYGIWKDIVRLGGVKSENPKRALRTFVERQTKGDANPVGVSDPRFLAGEQANQVIEGLKAWRERLQREAA